MVVDFNEWAKQTTSYIWTGCEVQDFKKITDHSRRIYGIYLKFKKEKTKDHNM